MKVVFMGTPLFAVEILERLTETHEVLAVVTQPDKQQGRGKKFLPPPVKAAAIEKGIPVFQPEKLRTGQILEDLKSFHADVFVVAAYGQILSEAILNIPKYGCINVHGSLLPKLRGAAPIQYALLNGDEKTGITIMQMDKGLDTGDMLLKREIPIREEDTFESLHDKMAKLGGECLLEALTEIETGKSQRVKQDDSLSTYAHMINKEMGHINFNKSTKDIINLIRALNPAPCAYTFYEDEMLKIYEAEKYTTDQKGIPGEVLDILKGKGFVVKTEDGSILMTEIQKKGGKRMSCADFMRGYKIEIGKVLN